VPATSRRLNTAANAKSEQNRSRKKAARRFAPYEEQMPKIYNNLFHTMSCEQSDNAVKLDARIDALARHQIIVEWRESRRWSGTGIPNVHPTRDSTGFRLFPLKCIFSTVICVQRKIRRIRRRHRRLRASSKSGNALSNRLTRWCAKSSCQINETTVIFSRRIFWRCQFVRASTD